MDISSGKYIISVKDGGFALNKDGGTSYPESTTTVAAGEQREDKGWYVRPSDTPIDGRLSQEKTNEIWNNAIEEASQYAKEKWNDWVSSYAGE